MDIVKLIENNQSSFFDDISVNFSNNVIVGFGISEIHKDGTVDPPVVVIRALGYVKKSREEKMANRIFGNISDITMTVNDGIDKNIPAIIMEIVEEQRVVVVISAVKCDGSRIREKDMPVTLRKMTSWFTNYFRIIAGKEATVKLLGANLY